MAKKPYRIEVSSPTHGKPKYFLVKDVKVRDKKRKAMKYIGTELPPPAELEAFKLEHAYEMEIKAAKKKSELSASFFTSEYLSANQISELENLRYIYAAVTNLLTVNEAETYEKNFEINYISGTTQFEGNTLTLTQTKYLLLSGMTPKDKSLREINEVQNFKKVIDYRNRYRGKVTLDFIRNLHALVMDNIDPESAGTFRRTDDVAITGCPLDLAPAAAIEAELQAALEAYYSRLENECHPFEAAVLFHYTFEAIHPFSDGNGRVGREIFNYMLKKEKFPRLLFLGEDREIYITALQAGNDGDMAGMVTFLANLILQQRMSILSENLKKVVIPPKKKGQMRLVDF
jgi:Fic family protein